MIDIVFISMTGPIIVNDNFKNNPNAVMNAGVIRALQQAIIF